MYFKHGSCGRKIRSKEYSSWANMKQRCLNKKSKDYKNYGGRGVTICVRWLNFVNFLADMGPSNGMTIDRIDVNGNYEPGNCKWSTKAEQSANRRDSHIVSYRGENMILTLASKLSGISPSTYANRKRAGWSDERIFNTPLLVVGRTARGRFASYKDWPLAA